MPTNKNADLKSTLFDLLMMKEDNLNTVVIGLDRAIMRQKSIMDAEDVAYVEMQIEQLRKG
ncbi:MAG: hypothetical protein FWG45_02935 [Oscillospiraceae bacterium]|nr:hypothetical protein [Oscillospiraceae bacterium]